MAEQNRQTSRKSTPISRHPLFPAIVALWFGALFGLGSLAVRPTLLEELVLAASLDTLVPAAAPPLGLTARILLALGMALIGGVLGATVARRIARPKVEVRQRRRGATNAAETTRGYANSSTGHEIFEDDEGDYDHAGLSPNKRRTLAMSEDETPLELKEFAPLPGNGAPQILNVSDVGAEPIRPVPPRTLAQPFAPPPLETAALEPAHVRDQPSRTHEAATPHEAIARLERTFSVPQPDEMELFDQNEAGAPTRRFDRADAAPRSPVVQQAPLAQSRPGPVATAKPFAAPDAAPRPFAQPGLSQPVVTSASPDMPPRSFADPAPSTPHVTAPVDPTPEPAEAVAVKREPIALAGHVPLFREPEPRQVEPEAEPAAAVSEGLTPARPDPVAAAPAGAGFPVPQGAAARQLTGAELDGLSPVQLVERLAISIQRRRERAEADAAITPETPDVTGTTEVTGEAISPKPFALPAVSLPEPPRPPIVPAPMAMPAALRPVSTHAEDDDDDDLDAFELPARFVAPPPVATLSSAADTAPPAVAQPDREAIEEPSAEADSVVAEEETRVLADGYSSLLDLSRPAVARPQFVRIEEPEDTAGAIEPVVVFPGQLARAAAATVQPAQQTAPFASPGPRLATGGEVPAASMRRFDSPPAGATSAQAVSDQDAEEAERALRAALATLQRMSAVS